MRADKKFCKQLTLGCLLLASWLTSSLAAALAVPALQARVNDHAALLSAAEVTRLESLLARYEQRSKHQFAVLTLPSLGGEAIEPFAIRVVEAWKLGGKQRDDGLILLVAKAERQMRIEVGYGLEGDIPDAVASRVVREVLTPAFAAGDFAGGIERALRTLMHAAGGDEGLEQAPVAAPVKKRRSGLGLLLELALALLVLFAVLGRGRRRGGLLAAGLWGASRGGFGGGFGGGDGFGGFGGGGGGFGGGGASGRW